MNHELKKQNPDKTFHFIEKDFCPNMRNMTLEQVAECLRINEPQAKVRRCPYQGGTIPGQHAETG